ncbi:carbohydrate-binding module family 21 protein [Laetiporus sulphureus 93-53]|uniref:Carbohydrate-binding module family 21 protein n=1 Tax=Laetiporus sulphureus 93-53 TaxID=1314785 RepID=A0A165C1W0_9APHY|nr:carbohydrate-binding module family 21 protein [Laetiporus sulphureus 93-53]KZT02051.1 carbohydrate-binding module family 21 protein [Laetiporus sulphureus 93-53]
MPYAVPAVERPSPPSSNTSSMSSSAVTSPRAAHRRTRSANNFSDERGPGAFAPMGQLPRSHKRRVFHIDVPDDDSPPDDDKSFDISPLATPRPINGTANGYLSPPNSLRLSMTSGKFSPAVDPPSRIDIPPLQPASVPFPTSSPLSPSDTVSPLFAASSSLSSSPPASSLPRTPSTPIILSNGKPLKPSLKSSCSSPNVAGMVDRAHKHLRAQSAPSTPAGPKNVHFAEKDAGLETVRVFNRSGKPASLSKPPGEETETETEAESSSYVRNSFPFPSFAAAHAHTRDELPLHEIDPSPDRTNLVPAPNPSPYANIYLETLALPRTRPPALRGTVLVRNITFEKRVVVRFTLDDWQTTSEVTCKHVVSLPSLPPPFPQARTMGDVAGSIAHGDVPKVDNAKSSWDRFSFTIRLEDYEHKLCDRTLYLVARYSPGCGGEFWDNNGGKNFRVGFRRVASLPAHSHNLAGMGLGMGMGMGLSSAEQRAQQRTFSAPSTMRPTPTTAAIRDRESSDGARERALAAAAAEVEAEKARAQPYTSSYAYGAPPSQLVRSMSSPHQRSSLSEDKERPSSVPTSPTQAYIKKKLSLSNYVAPCVEIARETTPIGRARSASLPSGAGMSADSTPSNRSEESLCLKNEEGSPGPQRPLMVLKTTMIGGHPATMLVPAHELEPLEFKLPYSGVNGFGAEMGTGLGIEFPAPGVNNIGLLSPPRSPEEQSPGSSTSTTGTPSGAAHRERDSSYAALIRQWCFTGSPTGMPSPNGGAFGNGGAKEGARGYGFPGFGFGMSDAGMVGGELRVLFMLGWCLVSRWW